MKNTAFYYIDLTVRGLSVAWRNILWFLIFILTAMSMIETLKKKFTEERLALFFPNQKKLQNFFDDLAHNRAYHLSEYYQRHRKFETFKTGVDPYTKEKLEEEESKEGKGMEVFENMLKMGENGLKVQYLDESAEYVGAWFEAGHLGPGVIEYNGKKFIAS